MNPDDLQKVWQTQPPSLGEKVNMEQLLSDLQQTEKKFAANLRRRDVLELSVSALMIPIWVVLGLMNNLPWTWYLTVPALIWIGGFMLVELLRRRRRPTDAGSSLRDHLAASIAEVKHQIRLLQNVFWWYLLPLGLAILAFLAQIAWRSRLNLGWLPASISFAVTVGIVGIVFAGVYSANQRAVRTALEPRRRELDELWNSLEKEELPGS